MWACIYYGLKCHVAMQENSIPLMLKQLHIHEMHMIACKPFTKLSATTVEKGEHAYISWNNQILEYVS